jgi:hypothetical protein
MICASARRLIKISMKSFRPVPPQSPKSGLPHSNERLFSSVYETFGRSIVRAYGTPEVAFFDLDVGL